MTHSQLYVRKTDFIKVKNCLNDNQLLHSDVILTVSTPSVDQPESQPVLMVNTSTVSTPSVDQPESQPVLMVNTSTVSTPSVDQPESQSVLMVNTSTVSTPGVDQPESQPVLMVNTSTVSTKRRSRGEGTGRIQWRTITKKNGKQYQQAWYDWQIHSSEKTISKSTYIPKRFLTNVLELEAQKAPVREILKLLR